MAKLNTHAQEVVLRTDIKDMKYSPGYKGLCLYYGSYLCKCGEERNMESQDNVKLIGEDFSKTVEVRGDCECGKHANNQRRNIEILKHYVEQKTKESEPPPGDRHFCKSSRFHEALCWLRLIKSGSFQKEAV